MYLTPCFNLFQTGYSVVAACVVVLRWKDKKANQLSCISTWQEGVICLTIVPCCGFATGLLFRFGVPLYFLVIPVAAAILASTVLYCRQVSINPHYTLLSWHWNTSTWEFSVGKVYEFAVYRCIYRDMHWSKKWLSWILKFTPELSSNTSLTISLWPYWGQISKWHYCYVRKRNFQAMKN